MEKRGYFISLTERVSESAYNNTFAFCATSVAQSKKMPATQQLVVDLDLDLTSVLADSPDRSMLIPLLAKHIQDWGAAHNLSPEQVSFVQAGVLQNAFAAVLFLQKRDIARATEWIAKTWSDYAQQAAEIAPGEEEMDTALEYELAVWTYLAGDRKLGRGRQILRRMMAVLGLSQDEAGRAFGVTGETIRRWERGQVRIPDARLAEMTSVDAALSRLQALFLSGHLSQAIRRPAELFHGERGLDLILRGLIRDVAAKYESALSWQA